MRRPHWSEAAYSDLDHFTGFVGADATYPLTSKTKEPAGRCVYCAEPVFVDRNVNAMSELARFDHARAELSIVHPACHRLDPFGYLDRQQRIVIERHYGLINGLPEPLNDIVLKRAFSTRGGGRGDQFDTDEIHTSAVKSLARLAVSLGYADKAAVSIDPGRWVRELWQVRSRPDEGPAQAIRLDLAAEIRPPSETTADLEPLWPSPNTEWQLDHALYAWVQDAVPEWTAARRVALMSRIGWKGGHVPTLEEIGEREGLTRERIRQLQVKLLKQLRSVHPAVLEPFERATQLLRDHASDPECGPGQLLAEYGLVKEGLPEEGVELMLQLLGLPEVFVGYQESFRAKVPKVGEALAVAKALTRSVGVVSIEWVRNDSGTQLDAAALKRELDAAPWCAFLDGEWFWDPATPDGRNRLVNVTVKMLAACGPLTLRTTRDGLDRNLRVGRLTHLPSLEALRLFYRAHPTFEIGDGDIVSSTTWLDPEKQLDKTELTLYRILRSAKDGFLARGELFRLATQAGMNPNTFSVYTSYSPILDNPMQDRWVLRGHDVSPAALEVQRKRRRRRHSADEWTERGTLRLERETPAYPSMVTSIGKALKPYLAGRDFRAFDTAGAAAGYVRWDENGTSWGYSTFLQTQAATEGDVLMAEFDLSASKVILGLRRNDKGLEDDDE